MHLILSQIHNAQEKLEKELAEMIRTGTLHPLPSELLAEIRSGRTPIQIGPFGVAKDDDV
jgi:hypothetical protein